MRYLNFSARDEDPSLRPQSAADPEAKLAEPCQFFGRRTLGLFADLAVLHVSHAGQITPTNSKWLNKAKRAEGGVGTSTIGIQLGGIASNLGYRALILDTDPQQSATDWRSLREDTSIAVWSYCSHQVHDLVKQADEAGFDLILIDNAPVPKGASAEVAALAALSLVMVPSTLDLVVGLEWIAWLKALNQPFAVAIGAAPPYPAGDRGALSPRCSSGFAARSRPRVESPDLAASHRD